MKSNKKIQLTLRIRQDISEKITEKAKNLGISVNAFITMVLSREVNKEKEV